MIFICIRTGFCMSLEGTAVGQDKFTYKFSMTVCSTWKIKMFLWVAKLVFSLLPRVSFQ